MPIYEALASWWVGVAVMASFVIFTPEGVNFIFISCRVLPFWMLSADA